MSKKHDEKLAALRAALVEGEQSGPAEPFAFEEFLSERRKERKTRMGSQKIAPTTLKRGPSS
jgi:Arc/MetJ-type ribon-helix-helix transcriptional regulator